MAMVIPAHAGIQEVLGLWIPAYAGMTFPLDIHDTSKQIAESPSFVEYQRRLRHTHGNNNVQTL